MCSEYAVTLRVDNGDLLRRVALLNSAMYRVLRVSKLKKIIKADYRQGELVMHVLAEKASPDLVPGEVHIEVEEVK